MDDLYGGFDPVLTVRKVRVTAGEKRRGYVVYTFRELTDLGGLEAGRSVVLGDLQGEPEDGGKVLLSRRRWQLRPGDLAAVDLGAVAAKPGFFVPEGAIQFDGSEHFVWLARPAESGIHQVARVRVKPGRTVGGLQRVEPQEGDALQVGAKLVVSGAHYVTPGEKVSLVEEVGVDR